MADFTAKQGDQSSIAWTDTLTYSDGTAVNLAGATVKFVMRALTATDVTTNLAATVTNAATGAVSYTPTAADTKNAGEFAAYWAVTFSGGGTEVFPTVGYLTVEIQQNLTTPGGASIVSLADVKNELNIPSTDRSHDAELLRFIDGVTPVVEMICGPILQRVYQNETYQGGMTTIALRHRPVLEVNEVVEYRGPIRYILTQAPTPDLGSIYSYMFEPPGYITRRTVGGGIVPFPPGTDAVFVTYAAGYLSVPSNVREGTLELVRIRYQRSQQAGRRPFGQSQGEDEPGQQIMGFFVPGYVREWLQPNKRYPSIA